MERNDHAGLDRTWPVECTIVATNFPYQHIPPNSEMKSTSNHAWHKKHEDLI